MNTEIGAYDAKTRLPELLRQVKAGKRFTITNRGVAIADLIPSESGQTGDARTAIDAFQCFLQANPVKPQQRGTVRKLLEEGRE
jgi:prevent-host-death family protein